MRGQRGDCSGFWRVRAAAGLGERGLIAAVQTQSVKPIEGVVRTPTHMVTW